MSFHRMTTCILQNESFFKMPSVDSMNGIVSFRHFINCQDKVSILQSASA